MFRALLCPSSGTRDYDVDYHIGVSFLVCCRLGVGAVRLELRPGSSLQAGHHSSLQAT